MRVARVALGAQLPQLLGAHPAAAAAVQHEADAGGAARRQGARTLALAAAVLAGGGLGKERTSAGRTPLGALPFARRAPPHRRRPRPPRGSGALTRLQRAKRSTKTKPTGDMVGAQRAVGSEFGSGGVGAARAAGQRDSVSAGGGCWVAAGGRAVVPVAAVELLVASCKLHWLPPLRGEELLCGVEAAARSFYTHWAAPARQ